MRVFYTDTARLDRSLCVTDVRSLDPISSFEVWDNVRDDEVAELEGLFGHLYRPDSAATASLGMNPGLTVHQREYGAK